jgi:hypothetical protein
MAKKKLSRDQKRKQKKQKKQQRKQRSAPAMLPGSQMRRRLQEMGVDNYKMVQAPPGAAKMSDVLMDFIEPYKPYADTTDAMHRLIITAIVAWNTALEPPEKHAELLQSFIKTLPPDAVEDFEAIVREMIERKNKHFAQHTRQIVNYELTEMDDSYHIFVASTLGEGDEK